MSCIEMYFLVTQIAIDYTRSDSAEDCAVDVPVMIIHMESKDIAELMVHNMSIH